MATVLRGEGRRRRRQAQRSGGSAGDGGEAAGERRRPAGVGHSVAGGRWRRQEEGWC
jgi:hypothetical protein